MKRFILLTLSSCISLYALSFTITKEQLYNMLKNAKPEMVMLGGAGINYYKCNKIDSIDCYSKKGHLKRIENSPSIEVRITNKKGRRRVYYFDTILLQDSTSIVGCESRILNIYKKMDLDDIEKIEMEDGGKNYYYQNK